ITLVGQGLSALSFAILLACLLSHKLPIGKQQFVDLGSLLETLVILYAYVCFAQFLVNWSGNEQREIEWYVRRTTGGWRVIGAMLIVFEFFVPFFLLLMRAVKQRPAALGAIAALILLMHLLDTFWKVAPPTTEPHPRLIVYWTDFAALIGIGGIWFGTFLMIWSRRALVP